MSLITKGYNTAKIISKGFFGKLINIIKPDIIITPGRISLSLSNIATIQTKLVTLGEIDRLLTTNGKIRTSLSFVGEITTKLETPGDIS